VENDIILRIENISKSYPGVQALDNVTIEIYSNEIHGLVGENGAGKSTLLNILDGITEQDDGKIILNQKEVRFENTRMASDHGIALVHQELSLIEYLTVAENIFLGNEPAKGSWVNSSQLYKDTIKILEKMGIFIDPTRLVAELDVPQRQIVEICKAISLNPIIIALDEPTGLLMEHQVDNLMKILRKMQAEGVTILYVSHRLNELFEIVDRVTVLRDGNRIGTVNISETSEDEIIRMMVGRSIRSQFPKIEISKGKKVLEVKSLTLETYFKNVSFCLHESEILGIGGLIGCRREQLGEALFGLRGIDSGDIIINGEKVSLNNPIEAMNKGIGYIPADRSTEGLMLSLPVDDNITAAIIGELTIAGIVFDKKRQSLIAKDYVNSFGIKISNLKEIVLNLSGGNRQKVLMAKWLACKLSILIINEPTRGVDVAAKAEIHLKIGELTKNGMAIILITSELPELIGISDKIVVMSKGVIKGEFLRPEFDQEKIMKLATAS
jgi:ribose transport system ATP-binding protein